MRTERRTFNRALLEFMGPKMADLIVKNYHLLKAKKEAKIYRMVSEMRKFEHV